MRTINFSDARKNFKEVLDRVVDDVDVTIITRRDGDDVVMMSLSEYNGWKEAEYLLASPANARQLRASIAQLDAGRKVYRDIVEPAATYSVNEPRGVYRVKSAKAKSARVAKHGKKPRG